MQNSKYRNFIIGAVISLLALFAFVWYFNFHYFPQEEVMKEPPVDSVLVKQEITKMYGIPVDSFNIISDKVHRNQMLLSILDNYRMPPDAIRQLILSSHSDFDFRKIKAGNKYVAFLDKDSLATLRYIVYEISPVDYVRFSFGDSLTITTGKKEISQLRKSACGSIRTSLWNTMVEKNIDPLLAVDLSEIYAWSIDFFELQPGDSFNVVYDVQYIDTVPVGLGKIYAAYFRHNDEVYYAIPFVQDSVESYYDVDGKSLRKAFLKAPLRYSRISSRFSNSRYHPILKIRRPHHGVDYAAPVGTPVHSVGDGRVIEARHGYNRGGGNFIKIRHNSVYTTSYMHLSRFAPGIKAGVTVQQGQLIGYVGKTGLATGPHLDFRFYKNGKAVDPLKVKAPPVEPIHESNLAAFDSAKTRALDMLAADTAIALKDTVGVTDLQGLK